MNIEILIVFFILTGAVTLFMMEKMPVDLTAVITMAALLLTGIISPDEAISGFSNRATVTVAAMFILSAAVFRTGVLNFAGNFIGDSLSKNYLFGQFTLLIIVGFLSAFINVTAIVALFMPVIISISGKIKISPSKLLMPLSFGALLGGVSTLIGTSTNILVSSIAVKHDLPAFGMFEMTPFGIIVLVAGIIYMLLIGIKFLPDRINPSDYSEKYQMEDYITEIVLLPNAQSVNTEIRYSPLVKDLDIDIIEIQRGDDYHFFPNPSTVLLANDILKVRCKIDKLKNLHVREGIKLKSDRKVNDYTLTDSRLVEAVVTHNSKLIGKTLKRINFRATYGATVLAIRHRGVLMHEKLGKTPLLAGDVLLIEVKQDWLPRLRQTFDFIIISEVNTIEFKKKKAFIAVAVIFLVVFTAAIGLVPIVQSAVIGSVLMVLTGVISLDEAYQSINWKVIFLLAGVLTLGLALEKTGAAALIAQFLISSVGTLGNRALVSAFFFLTLLFTNFMSNNATAAVIAPIAIITADSLGLNSRPFLMAVTFAASLSFMTPVGYQTNTMIYEPGNYKFTDYIKVGGPLDLILWILATILIPILFPF